MTVKQLIQKLQAMPQDSEVVKSDSSGCGECNYDGLEMYNDIYGPNFLAEGHYPNHKMKNIVVL